MQDTPLAEDQELAIDFALDRPGAAWFMPPGMGKTRSWFETILETDARTLVVAPKLVCMTTWPEENRKWQYNFPMRFLHGKEKHIRGSETVSLINYEALPWLAEQLQECKRNPYKYVIYDELSRLKNPTTQRFKKWRKVANRFEYRLGGTGTPVGNHLMDLWGEMYMCDLGKSLGDNFYKFRGTHFDKNEYTYQYTPYEGAEDSILNKISKNAISFDINDLGLADPTHNPIYLKLPKAVKKYYEQLHKDSVIEDLDVYAVNGAVRSGKKRQLASGAIYNVDKELVQLHNYKIDAMSNVVSKLRGRPLIVFFEYLHDYIAICDMFGPTPALYGGTKEKDAVNIYKDWNAGRIPILALHPRSAAYGLNLQQCGHDILWYTVPWSYEMINQGIARLWRRGQLNQVNVNYLVVEETEDERVYDKSIEMSALHDRVMSKLLWSNHYE